MEGIARSDRRVSAPRRRVLGGLLAVPARLEPPSAAAHQSHRGRLFRKYFALILALVCGALLISGGLGAYFAYQEKRQSLAALQREKALSAAVRIQQFVRQIEQQLVFLTQVQLRGQPAEQRLELIKLLHLVPPVTDVALLDAQGREQLVVSRRAGDVIGSGKDRSAEPAFRDPRAGQTWFGPVYFRQESEPTMTMSVRRADAGLVTVAQVNLKFIWDVVSRIKIGEQGRAYVVDESGYLVAHPDIGLVLRKTDLSPLAHVQAALRPDADAEPAMLGTDPNGVRVLSAHAPVEPLNWRVFVEQPVAEVYASLDQTVLRNVALIAGGLVLSALAALRLARSMVQPIDQLQRSAQRIGAGDLQQRIDIRTGDELEALAAQFNRMSEQLRESYAGLERKVEERTAELQRTLERQTATAEILRVVSDSPTDVAPVFGAIVERAVAQCGGTCAALYRYDGAQIELAAASAGAPARPPAARPADRSTPVGRAIVERAVVNVADLAADPQAPQDTGAGPRSLVVVPMLRDGQPIGAIAVARELPGGFGERDVAVLQTFADQAVIALRHARLFEELRDKSLQLEIASQHKSAFLANMSHELRTPLNAVIGFSEMLAARYFGELTPKQAEYVDDILASGRHLLALINDILDLSKIEAGRMELQLSEFDLAQAIGEAAALVRQRAQRSALVLEVACGGALGTVVGDARKTKEIVLNLLANAVKFTPAGGTVRLAAERSEGRVQIAVSDTGPGIAPQDQALIFEAFRQVGSDLDARREGTGLGLALSRRYAELHGGTLEVASTPGAGATFTLTMPARHGT